MTFFSEKISIFTPKISDDLFFPYLYCVKCRIYDPFFTRKPTISENNSLMTPFLYSVRTFARIRQHYYWGDGCMGHPSPQILGDRPPSPTRSPPLLMQELK